MLAPVYKRAAGRASLLHKGAAGMMPGQEFAAMSSRSLGWLGMFFSLAVPLVGIGQAPVVPGAKGDIQLRTRGTTQTLLLDGFAKDKAGLALHGVGAAGLVLRDNRRVVKAGDWTVLDAASVQASVQEVVVLDAVNSSLAQLVRSEDGLERFLAAQPAAGMMRDLTILIVSDTVPKADAASATASLHHRQLFVHRIPASSNAHALLQSLREYKPGLQRILEAQGATGQAERVRLSLEALSFIANGEKAVAGAKLVVWLSPGWPYLAESDARSSQQLFDSVVYFSDLLREARLILYVVHPVGVTAHDTSSQMEGFELATRPGFNSSGTARVPETIGKDYYKDFVRGAARPSDANPNDLALQVLAVQSGGLVLPDNNDLRAGLERCLSDAGFVLTVAYTPAGGSAKEPYHAVTLERGSAPLRIRTGFYLR